VAQRPYHSTDPVELPSPERVPTIMDPANNTKDHVQCPDSVHYHTHHHHYWMPSSPSFRSIRRCAPNNANDGPILPAEFGSNTIASKFPPKEQAAQQAEQEAPSSSSRRRYIIGTPARSNKAANIKVMSDGSSRCAVSSSLRDVQISSANYEVIKVER
jgi:hypothetical protein